MVWQIESAGGLWVVEEMIEDVVKLVNSLMAGVLLIDLPELLKHDKQLLILIESQLRRILRFLKLWSRMPPVDGS